MLVCNKCFNIFDPIVTDTCPLYGCDGHIVDIDDKIVFSICALGCLLSRKFKNKIRTIFSCQGHVRDNRVVSPYLSMKIEYNEEIVDEIMRDIDIEKIVESYLNNRINQYPEIDVINKFEVSKEKVPGGFIVSINKFYCTINNRDMRDAMMENIQRHFDEFLFMLNERFKQMIILNN